MPVTGPLRVSPSPQMIPLRWPPLLLLAALLTAAVADASSSSSRGEGRYNGDRRILRPFAPRKAPAGGAAFLDIPRCGGGGDNAADDEARAPAATCNKETTTYGRVSDDEYVLSPEQIETFRREGCVTIDDVLTEDEVSEIESVFDRFLSGEIPVPGKDFCDMSKPFGIPSDQWSIVNCMLPTTYYPPLRGNVYERLTNGIAQQLFADRGREMTKDYDQFLNKRPGKTDAVFAWHQDMAYWPGSKALGVDTTDTCTFSLAIDDSDEANGCLRYVSGSGVGKVLRPHRPLVGDSRDDGHALAVEVGPDEEVALASARRGSVTIHDEYVVHGSGGNTCPDRQRRTYVLAYRAKPIVEAERKIGFTHSHNDEVNWDTFSDGESHRVMADKNKEE